MANAGLSVKERLALLQNNNNNSNSGSGGVNNATNKPAGGPVKPAPTVTPKPKPSPSAEAKPGVGGFKPATPSKPAASSPRPGTPPDKPLPASKPAFAAKPGTAAKPFTPTPPPAKPAGADDAAKTNGSDAPLFPKLRPAGTTPPGRVTAPVSKQPPASSPSREAGVATDKPALTNKAQVTGAPEPEMRDRGNSVVTPLKPVSVQERLAALRQNSQSEVETVDPKSKHHHPNSVSPTTKSTTTTPKPSSAFPPTKPPVLKPVNRDLPDASAGPTPEFPGIKRSDIAKSLTQAADRVLRSKTTAAAAPAATDGSEADSKARHLFQRRSDGKKFRQVDVSSVISSEPAPALPTPLTSVDLKPFLKAYATAKEEKLKADGGKSSGTPGEENGVAKEEEEDVEELYVEAESTSVTIRGRKGSTKRATSARVSFIAEYTEEEEQQELYTDGSSGPRLPAPPSEPEEMYDDCQSAKEETTWQEPLPEEPDEIYEPLDEQLPEDLDTSEPEPTPPPLPSPNTRDKDKENKDKENKDKEEAAKRRDKAKEEASKKEEKERKKKEEDLKKMRRKFGLNDTDDKVGDGVVKNNAGGGVFSKDLAVVKGEIIAILRMDGNPAGKWLVQNEQGKLGYVSSNNIEISTPTIRNLMAGVKHDAATSEEPDEMYEPLPDGDMDEIYEEL